MIRKIWVIIVASIFLSSVTLVAAKEVSLSQVEESCRKWAEEDGISKVDIKDFMLECMKEIQNPSKHNKEITNQNDINFYDTSSQPLNAGE
ncbi:MAG: hypothetical protein HQL70_01225 [Magnetococcales bacterium]|nr:hypothetical protein [Magnetococcales bacterium]